MTCASGQKTQFLRRYPQGAIDNFFQKPGFLHPGL
jgi:hypothetical protein